MGGDTPSAGGATVKGMALSVRGTDQRLIRYTALSWSVPRTDNLKISKRPIVLVPKHTAQAEGFITQGFEGIVVHIDP
jgi:hypothetical protein